MATEQRATEYRRIQAIEQRVITNHRESLRRLSQKYPGAKIAMEVGTHSPWTSRMLAELRHEVLVANSRKVPRSMPTSARATGTMPKTPLVRFALDARHRRATTLSFCKEMKKPIPAVIVAILALGSLFGCKPHAGPSKSTGQSMGSAGLAKGADTEALIQALEQNDFEMIKGKNFQQILPGDTQYRGYEDLVALRDTTAKAPNEFVVGVGPDTVMWFNSRDISGGDAIADWEAHVQKRIALVERLAANQE